MNTSRERSPASSRLKPTLLVLLLMCGVGLLFYPGTRSWLQHVIEEDLAAWGVWGLVALSAFYVVATVAFIPGSLVTIGAGFLAAALWPDRFPLALAAASLAVLVGSNLGALCAFLLGRTLARDWVKAKTARLKTFGAVDRAIGENGLKLVTLIRLSPVFPFNFTNYLFGVTQVRARDYVLGTLVGMLPGIVLYVYIGAVSHGLATATGGEAGPWALVLRGVGFAATLVTVVLITRTARKTLREAVEAEETR